MSDNSATLHEDPAHLRQATIERHRATVSLMEELEAIDWYDQRVDATTDDELRAVLIHNRDDEKEHASMTLEWLRRHDPAFSAELQRYLFTTAPITGLAPEDTAAQGAPAPMGDGGAGPAGGDGSLGIGSLRSKEGL